MLIKRLLNKGIKMTEDRQLKIVQLESKQLEKYCKDLSNRLSLKQFDEKKSDN